MDCLKGKESCINLKNISILEIFLMAVFMEKDKSNSLIIMASGVSTMGLLSMGMLKGKESMTT